MAHKEQKLFCEKIKQLHPIFFKNKKVLDIGSLDINGSNRELFENCEYIGLDLGDGKNVDVISSGHLYDAPDGYFDTIISTEAFEHDMFYEKTIENIIRMLKPGGLFLFTCAAPGRPEHGTRRTGGFDAPLLIQQSEEWSDYYKNLTEEDIRRSQGFNINFPDGYFEINNNAEIPSDLYFYGIKGGSKYLTDSIISEFSKDQFSDDIFVIDCWIDNISKENDLIDLIRNLKKYNIPILLSGHYPVKPEIQKMVDFYLFDKNNPLLYRNEFAEYQVNSVRWSEVGNIRIDTVREFHHDYAIWETMRNTFNFCKYLGKQYIHFMEYDNLPDITQYRQAFLERVRGYDAVIYEYDKDSTLLKNPYCSTYIFSIKTDVAVNTINLIKTKDQFFRNKPDKWQLEKNFLNSLKQITNNILVSQYIPNNYEFNKQAVWNRHDVNKNGVKIEFYLGADDFDNLYLHVVSDRDSQIEVNYLGYKKFHNIRNNDYLFFNLGKYKKGHYVKAFHQGIEIYNEFLGYNIERFKELNKITINKDDELPKINVNFVDGPFVEILGNTEKTYYVQFINKKTDIVEFGLHLKTNHWARCNKKYYVDWLIRITGIDNDINIDHHIDLSNSRVFISFESKSLGDTLAWIPYVEKFRLDHECEIICSTFHNNLFEITYPSIKFVKPGTTVHNIHALYRLGVFHDDKRNIDYTKHLTDPKGEPLTKVASDILGMEYVEIKPQLPVLSSKKKKVVSIANHGTAQCKYWNHPTGWQEVVDYLVANGYEVKLLSSEEDGYMGNKNPEKVTKVRNKKIEDILKIIQESELFIGISSGLAWLAWGARTPVILISGFTDIYTEPTFDVTRIINKDVCNSCWNKYDFDPGDWNWCPVHKGTDRQFECSRSIHPNQVINEIRLALKL